MKKYDARVHQPVLTLTQSLLQQRALGGQVRVGAPRLLHLAASRCVRLLRGGRKGDTNEAEIIPASLTLGPLARPTHDPQVPAAAVAPGHAPPAAAGTGAGAGRAALLLGGRGLRAERAEHGRLHHGGDDRVVAEAGGRLGERGRRGAGARDGQGQRRRACAPGGRHQGDHGRGRGHRGGGRPARQDRHHGAQARGRGRPCCGCCSCGRGPGSHARARCAHARPGCGCGPGCSAQGRRSCRCCPRGRQAGSPGQGGAAPAPGGPHGDAREDEPVRCVALLCVCRMYTLGAFQSSHPNPIPDAMPHFK